MIALSGLDDDGIEQFLVLGSDRPKGALGFYMGCWYKINARGVWRYCDSTDEWIRSNMDAREVYRGAKR